MIYDTQKLANLLNDLDFFLQFRNPGQDSRESANEICEVNIRIIRVIRGQIFAVYLLRKNISNWYSLTASRPIRKHITLPNPIFTPIGTPLASTLYRDRLSADRAKRVANMNALETNQNDPAPQERFSRRVENGVRIFEHETVTTIKIDGDRYVTGGAHREPRLVIGDAVSRANLFVAKTRSDIRDLDNFLQNVIHPTLKVE